MPKLVDLDALVGPDFKLKYRDHEYVIPSDPPLEYILKLWSARDRLASAATLDDQVDVMAEMYAGLVRVFQVADPSVVELPFGYKATAAVLDVLFQAYGLASSEAEPEASEEDEAPLARKRSRSSSGSRSS